MLLSWALLVVPVTLGAGLVGVRRWQAQLATLTAEHARYWRRRAEEPGDFRYVALGDSLSQGLTARRPEAGFVGRLADHLEAREPGRRVAVLNLSVTGATIADLLAEQLPQLTELPAPDLVTVCIGTNDVGQTPPPSFRSSFEEMCAALPPGALVADIPTIPHGPHCEPAAELSQICREVLAEFPVLAPVRLQEATADLGIWEVGRDLVHPGARGHRKYAAAFEEALRRAPAHASTVTPTEAPGDPSSSTGGLRH